MRLTGFKVAGTLLLTLVTATSFSVPVMADANFDRYFASRVKLQDNWWQADNYEIEFVPTNNSYAYQIQVAGKSSDGKSLACYTFAAKDYDRLQVKDVKVDIGVDNPKAFNAKFGVDTNYVEVYGGYYNRYINPVFSQLHFRIAAYDQTGKQLYKTTWYGAPDLDIMKWNWPSQCSWVKQ